MLSKCDKQKEAKWGDRVLNFKSQKQFRWNSGIYESGGDPDKEFWKAAL